MTTKQVSVILLAAAGAAAAQTHAVSGRPLSEPCPIVDADREPWAGGSLGWTPYETIENSSESFGFFEGAGHLSAGYYRTRAGDFDLSLRGRLWLALNGENYEVPSVFGHLYLRTRWDVRLAPELTLRADAMPGYYAEVSHIEWDDFNVPLAVSGVATVDRSFAVQAGAAFYPGFENFLDPILLARWKPAAQMTVDLGYPENAIRWRPQPMVTLLAGHRFNRTWQFSLARSDPNGDFMYRDQRLEFGLDVGVAGWLTFSTRLALLMERELDFESGLYQDARVDDGILFTFGVSGAF